MKKEELVYLHMLLAQLKKYCEENCVNYDFKKYNDLVFPPSRCIVKKKSTSRLFLFWRLNWCHVSGESENRSGYEKSNEAI
jgi:hypothetical protein